MSDAVFLAIDLDASQSKPLFQQLYEAISRRIRERVIVAGARLPASRTYAAEIGVSRATVLVAYDQLIAEGYAEARQGSGVFASDIGSVAAGWIAPKPARAAPVPKPAGPRPFDHGVPDMRAFPHRQWAQVVGRVARSESSGFLETPDVFGDPVLRRAIADHLRDWRGVSVSPEQVVITAGAGDAMELVLQCVAADGVPVGLENPGYPVLAQACKTLGNPVEWLAVDGAGACLPDRPVALSVITPSCQFPLGMTMPIARRQAHLAAQGWIVEDDFDSEFRYSGTPVPALMALDPAQKVIYLGSFSKVFSSGLRLGYLVFPDPLLDRVRRVQGARGNRASVMPQRVLGRFMEDGSFHRHVRKMRRLYRGRRDVFLHGLAARLKGVLAFRDFGAGMSVALEFAAPLNEPDLRIKLREADLRCPMLSDYAFDTGVQPGMLCGFCAFDEMEIEDGLTRLESVLMPFLGLTKARSCASP